MPREILPPGSERQRERKGGKEGGRERQAAREGERLERSLEAASRCPGLSAFVFPPQPRSWQSRKRGVRGDGAGARAPRD